MTLLIYELISKEQLNLIEKSDNLLKYKFKKMGNCTSYCSGACKEEQRYDNSQVRGSIKDKDRMIAEGFQERYS